MPLTQAFFSNQLIDSYYPEFTTFFCSNDGCKREVPYTDKSAYVVEHPKLVCGSSLCCSKTCAERQWEWQELLRCNMKKKLTSSPVEGKDFYLKNQ